ncbi:HAD family hydrolase [Mucilaginibacter pallidiroseus]|uniref:HAD family hydrolase n=1 Tax=Mucilaginibacter pallidiroseus TaxID=2599295 RepID=A0A563UJ46_9SPHI|nr:HAD hydrolase-like protein [Mucilaginibacter pallidiroseus]TWR31410.1 HAD family hydrolase [Mucilaginibacter pallidiroseus]
MAALTYKDIDPGKKAFIFELDNVLYPEKDYLYQVYYLFSSLLEYTDLSDAKRTTDRMISAYNNRGAATVFDTIKEELGVDEKYRLPLDTLMLSAKLPLKLLLYQNMLTLLQEIVMDRKKIFIITNGNPQQQLNKIKQIEWNGLEPYLTCYFAHEIAPKPATNALEMILEQHGLQRREIVITGISDTDELFAQNTGVDFIAADDIL